MHTGTHGRQKKEGVGFPEVGVTNSCAQPKVGARKRTQVLSKINKSYLIAICPVSNLIKHYISSILFLMERRHCGQPLAK